MVAYVPSILLDIARNPVLSIGLPLALSFASGQASRAGMKGWYPLLVQPLVSHS